MPRMEIRGSGALVAGGASGLGAATARRLAAAGAAVTIADVDAERGEALASEIGAGFAHTDVRDEAQVQARSSGRRRPPAGCASPRAAPGSARPRRSPARAARTGSRPSSASSRST
jgi:nucleoside-diphosphate-sugar epimerase